MRPRSIDASRRELSIEHVLEVDTTLCATRTSSDLDTPYTPCDLPRSAPLLSSLFHNFGNFESFLIRVDHETMLNGRLSTRYVDWWCRMTPEVRTRLEIDSTQYM